MPDPDLERLDRIVEGDLADTNRIIKRVRRVAELEAEAAGADIAAAAAAPAAPAAAPDPDWSRTLLGLLDRLLDRLERVETDLAAFGTRLDDATDRVAAELVRQLAPLQRSEDALAVLNGQLAALDAQVREIRAAVDALRG